MEDLSACIRDPGIAVEDKREKGLQGKTELYTVCADKMKDLIKESQGSKGTPAQKLTPSTVLEGIFDGFKSIISRYQYLYVEQREQIRVA